MVRHQRQRRRGLNHARRPMLSPLMPSVWVWACLQVGNRGSMRNACQVSFFAAPDEGEVWTPSALPTARKKPRVHWERGDVPGDNFIEGPSAASQHLYGACFLVRHHPVTSTATETAEDSASKYPQPATVTGS